MAANVDYKALGEQISMARKASGMTREMLADSAEVSLSFLDDIERGERKVSLETTVRIFAVLKLSLDAALLPNGISAQELSAGKVQQRARLLLQTALDLADLE